MSDKPAGTLAGLMKEVGVLEYPAWFNHISLPNWPFPHQLEMLKNYVNNTRYGDFSDPGCVSADTEFLTPKGWKRIDQYEKGDKVAQYDPNNHQAEFVYPEAYIKAPCTEMYRIKPSRGVSMKLSGDHRVLSFTQGGSHYRVDRMEDIARIHEDQVNGFRGLFRSTFTLDAKGVPLSEEAIRVMVMTLADGSFPADSGNRCIVRVLKERKKIRCRQTLEAAGITYKERALADGYTSFTYYAPRREKNYTGDWWEASSQQKAVILDEVRHWDGSLSPSGGFTFTSLNREDIDYIQFVSVTSGLNAYAKMTSRTCQGRPMVEGTVIVSSKALMHRISSASSKTQITKEPTEDGYKYCFTVPSSFLVLRHAGRVFTTGNCGKSFPAQAHAVLMAALGNKVVFTMPPRLIRQFHGEIKDFFQGIDQHLEISHLDVGAVQKAKRIAAWDRDGWPDILLLSYDAFRAFNDLAAKKVAPRNQWKREDGVTSYWVTDPKTKQKVPWDTTAQPFSRNKEPILIRRGKAKAENPNRLRLKKVGYSVYFFDEAHALCNPEAIVWKSIQHIDHELKDDIALYLMTGTPIPTHLHNVYGLIKLLNREAYQSKSNFERKHCIMDWDSPYKVYLDYKDEDKVYEALYKYATRILKRAVLPHLKVPSITATPIALKGKHKRLYDKILSERFAVLGTQVLTPDNDSALRMLAMQLVTCPDEFDDTGEIGKDNEVSKWLDQLIDSINPANHKVIVFAYFKNTVNFLAKRLAKWNPAVMNGATSKGWAEVERFKTDDACRVFVVNWGSGGAGLNLQVAHHSIFYEIPTSPKDAKQAIARTDRQGQLETPFVYFPKVLGTLLDRNFKNLLKNERSNNKVVRDTQDLLYEQLKVSKRKAA